MADILIYGPIGDAMSDDSVRPRDVLRALEAAAGDDITVRINSAGGVLADGIAIYNALRSHPGRVRVLVEGAAMSAASVVAMGGDEIVMLPGAWLMMHDPAIWLIDGRGTGADHRAIADELERLSDEVARIYAARARQDIARIRQMMREETILVGEEAVRAGFADRYEAAAEATAEATAITMTDVFKAFAPFLGSGAGGPASAQGRAAIAAMMAGYPPLKEEAAMPEIDVVETEGAETPAMEKSEMHVEMNGGRSAAEQAARERERCARISALSARLGVPEAAGGLIAEGVAVDVAAERLAEMRARRDEALGDAPVGRATAKVMVDEREKFREGAQRALMAKVGLVGGERNEFSSLSLAEVARAALEMAGDRAPYADKRTLVGRAFTMAGGSHSTSDFPNILQNVMGKAALQGWEEAEETFGLWTRQGSLSDFKPTKRVGAGVLEALPEIPEGAEYTYGSVSDRGENIALATYGRVIRITRQAIINDDLAILGDLPRKAGRAARRTIGNLVYAVLANNPTMSDGVALFHASHGNLLTGGSSALSVDALAAARAAMRKQKDAGAALNIRPRYLIVPAALETAAQQLIASAVDPRDSKGHAINPVSGMAEVIADARLDDGSASAWFLAADPAAYDTVEVAYLDGNDSPYIEQDTEWTTDGVALKVRIDAGVAPLDWRTMLKAAGA